ncbi:MAG: hypothetical protein CL676_10950 [Bdellovibrionaceae bacterium]|nr:hypothetical protein [Pseudobdellovibrionaceae bacterium]
MRRFLVFSSLLVLVMFFQNCTELDSQRDLKATSSIQDGGGFVDDSASSPDSSSDSRLPDEKLQDKAQLAFEEIQDLNLRSSYSSCSPDISNEVHVRVFKYKVSFETQDELIVVAYLPNSSRYISQTSSSPSLPAVAMFHGGGHSVGNPIEYFARLGPRLASNGVIALGFQYRLMKVHGTTRLQASQDALSALHWMHKNASLLGIDLNRTMTLGMSAGGHLANLSAYLSQTQDKTISDVRSPTIPRVRGASVFYPMSKIHGHPEVSLNDLAEKALNQGISLPLKIRVHMAEFAIPPSGETPSEPDKLNQETIQFCDQVNRLGGDCVYDITSGSTHNFADTAQFYSTTLNLLEADLFHLLGVAVNFSDDVETAATPCLPPSSAESIQLLYQERKKFHNYVCNQYKYSQQDYCHLSQFTQFMSDPMPVMQAQVLRVKYLKKGQEVHPSSSAELNLILENGLALKNNQNRFSVVVPDPKIPGDFIYARDTSQVQEWTNFMWKRTGEIHFRRLGSGILEVYSSPLNPTQSLEYDQVQISMRIVNGDLGSNRLRGQQILLDPSDKEIARFYFNFSTGQIQKRSFYMGANYGSL